jgi:hypothetical protein
MNGMAGQLLPLEGKQLAASGVEPDHQARLSTAEGRDLGHTATYSMPASSQNDRHAAA